MGGWGKKLIGKKAVKATRADRVQKAFVRCPGCGTEVPLEMPVLPPCGSGWGETLVAELTDIKEDSRDHMTAIAGVLTRQHQVLEQHGEVITKLSDVVGRLYNAMARFERRLDKDSSMPEIDFDPPSSMSG